MSITRIQYEEAMRQLAYLFAKERPDLLEDFQLFWEYFQQEQYMADGDEQLAYEGWCVALAESRGC